MALPMACTLSPVGLAERRSRWERLGERSLREREEIAGGVRLTYAAAEGVEGELRELARLEAECCAFASWQVSVGEGEVVLEVTADGEGAEAVRAIFIHRG
jgi:hypothetical protein